MRLYGLQTGVADRNVRRFLVALASQVQRFLSAHDASSGRHPAGSPRDCTLRGSPRRRFCRACSASLLGCTRFPPEPCQNTSGDFQLIEFAAQFFPFGIKPRQPLRNPLLLLFHQRSHFIVSPWSADRPPFAVLRYSPTNANEAYQKTT